MLSMKVNESNSNHVIVLCYFFINEDKLFFFFLTNVSEMRYYLGVHIKTKMIYGHNKKIFLVLKLSCYGTNRKRIKVL
jgi:hypothetical protein